MFGYDLTGSMEATGRLVKEAEEELDGAMGSVALICRHTVVRSKDIVRSERVWE